MRRLGSLRWQECTPQCSAKITFVSHQFRGGILWNVVGKLLQHGCCQVECRFRRHAGLDCSVCHRTVPPYIPVSGIPSGWRVHPKLYRYL
jgi:hypothetical protein